MNVSYHSIVPGLWIIWLVYWAASSRSVKPTRRRESAVSRAAHIVPLTVAALLIALPRFPGQALEGRFLPNAPLVYGIGACIVVAGLAFTVWARIHLGRNWRGTVTLKYGHELVRSGPYRIVRHPIYTGLLVVFAGSAIARSEWRGIVAVFIAFAALWRKLRLEERWMVERWMVETFGNEYLEYRVGVAALILFVY